MIHISNDKFLPLIQRSDVPVILMFGTPRAGKSSIRSVLFERTTPYKTMFLDPTVSLSVEVVELGESFTVLIIEVPAIFFERSKSEEETSEILASLFKRSSSIIGVIDSQHGDGMLEVEFASEFVMKAISVNPDLYVEVFIHKMDGGNPNLNRFQSLGQEYENFVTYNIECRLSQNNMVVPDLSFHTTSIYDNSINDAMSKSISKAIPLRNLLTPLLDVLANKCSAQKALLIDNTSNLMFASDSVPFDSLAYEMCSGMLDVLREISQMYFSPNEPFRIGKSRECKAVINEHYSIYTKEIEKNVCVAFLIRRTEAYDHDYIIDKNVEVFRKMLREGHNAIQ